MIEESSTRVADALVRLIDDHLDGVSGAADLEEALTGLVRAWAALQREFAEHFALVRQMQAEAASMPRGVLEAWNSAGPQRVEGSLARHLRVLAAQGFVDVDEPSLAAEHFLLLTVGVLDSRSGRGAVPLDDPQTARIIETGVRAFLKGYLVR